MTRFEKAWAAAVAFAESYDPYELADAGMSYFELVDETAWLLMDEPETVLGFFGEE